MVLNTFQGQIYNKRDHRIASMKIMHIIDSGGLYGAEVMLLELMSGQKKLGLEPFLCSMGNPGQADKEIERQARNRGLKVVCLRTRAGLNPFAMYQLLATARSNAADILHSHGYKGNILVGCIPGRLRRIPLVCTVHGWTNTVAHSKLAVYEWLDRKMLRYKDAVIVVNKLMLEDARLISAQIASSKLHVVNNGIDRVCHTVDKSDDAMSLINHFTREGFVIGAIGRLSREKGFEYLLVAVAELYRSGYNIRLVIIGDGPLNDDLHDLVTRLEIDPIVLFTGYLANASAYLDCLDMLVISSLSEGLPITLLEAMRAHVPVVSTRVGGIPDVISDGVSGTLVPPGDASALRDGIKLLIEDSGLRNTLTLRANARFMENHTSEKMARDYLAIYNRHCLQQ